jgi:nitroreductase
MSKKNNNRRDFCKKGALIGGGLWLLKPDSSSHLAAYGSNAADNQVSSLPAAVQDPPASGAVIWDVFKNRRSVRQFKTDAIPEKDIVKIVEAARLAPTSGNQQPWKFLVVRDKEKIILMKETCVKEALAMYDQRQPKTKTREQFEAEFRQRMSGYFSAPVYIVILTDNRSKYPDYNHWDGPMAAGYLMLAARALGYGTVFITDSIPESVTKAALKIPDCYTRVCITPVGVPVEWPKPSPKRNIEDFLAYDTL